LDKTSLSVCLKKYNTLTWLRFWQLEASISEFYVTTPLH